MSLLSRRYMRGVPGRTEKSIGVLVLVLLGLIVGAFLTTGLSNAFSLPEKPLFTIETKYLERTLPPAEHRHAETLLPAEIADLKREDEIAIVHIPPESGEQLPDPLLAGFEGLLAQAAAYDAQVAYACRYGDGSIDYSVMIVDAGEPARAFGLSHARRAQSALQAGRFYGEVVGPESAQTLAASLAGRMLDYGRPFWAEAVLPSQGRVDESLRYVHRDAFGVSGFGPCWAADYESGASVVVAQLPADRRSQVFELLATTGGASSAPGPNDPYGENSSYSEESSYGGEESSYSEESAHDETRQPPELPSSIAETLGLGDAACVVRLDDRNGVAMIADIYLFIVLGDQSDTVTSLATGVRDRWTVSQAGAGATVPASPKARSKHFPEVEGLDAPTTIESYIDNLYEKINGREPQFLAYYFIELQFGQYVDARNNQGFDTYIFNMGNPANAFGIYSKERSGSTGPAGIGRESYQSGTATFFCKGPLYVYVLGPADGGDAATEVSLRIAQAIADTIEDDGEPFWAERLLPETDRVPNSLSYHATSALSYKFLNELFLAKYETNGEAYEMFLIKAASAEEAAGLYTQLGDSFEASKYDEVKSRTPHDGGETLVSDSLGYFTVTFHSGVYFGGVRECENQQLATGKAAELRARLEDTSTRTESGEQSG